MVVRVLSCTPRSTIGLLRRFVDIDIFMHAYNHRCQLPLSPTAPLSTIYSYVPLTMQICNGEPLPLTSPTLTLEITRRHSGEHSRGFHRAEFETEQQKKTRRWLSKFDASHQVSPFLPSSPPPFRPSKSHHGSTQSHRSTICAKYPHILTRHAILYGWTRSRTAVGPGNGFTYLTSPQS